MNALRLEQAPVNHQLIIDLPINFTSPRVEIIILPLEEDISEESKDRLLAFEKTGFVQQVLADEAEDVWNDL
jgi:hypothetical protein